MPPLMVGLNSWIIRDGNYPDFKAGSIETFALEFAYLEERYSNKKSIEFIQKSSARCSGTAKVIYKDEVCWFLEFKDFVACNVSKPPANIDVGNYLSGEFYIGVDPFMYREEVLPKAGTPKITKTWRIESIHLVTTPWIIDRNILKRASSIDTYEKIECTGAWNDDGGNAEYILECTSLD